MSHPLDEQIQGLLTKYTELLLGDSTEERTEQVKKWVIYSYISQSMPALVKHWNDTYPDGKEGMKELILEIKSLNETHRNKKNK